MTAVGVATRKLTGEYWVVDSEVDAIKVYRLVDGRYRREAEMSVEAGDELESPVFPGLRVPVAEIFG